jgi:hypothetical protein
LSGTNIRRRLNVSSRFRYGLAARTDFDDTGAEATILGGEIPMIQPASRLACISAALLLLAACAAQTGAGSQPGTAAAPASTAPAASTAAADEPPPDVHEASAECWMKYDKSGASLDDKAKLVDKCINDKMKGTGAKR